MKTKNITKNITINIPDGYDDVKFNEKTHEIEFIKKDDKPRSWGEYREQVYHTPCFAAHLESSLGSFIDRNRGEYPLISEFNTEEEAKAIIALCKLIQLRDAWWGDWKPDWTNLRETKFAIRLVGGNIIGTYLRECNAILAFPTEEMRDEFLETFKDLIEQAKILL